MPAARCADSERRARSLSDLVATASNDQNRDQQIGRTLFNLLIPVELEAYLASSGEMRHRARSGDGEDSVGAARHKAIPSSRPPWAIRVKLLRKLRIARFREHVTYADADASALVIGEPECPKDTRGSSGRAAKPLPCAAV